MHGDHIALSPSISTKTPTSTPKPFEVQTVMPSVQHRIQIAPQPQFHSVRSQLATLSWMVNRWRSICQKEYSDLVAPAAFRCAGPVPPFFASSGDLQMQVARLRRSSFGVPNQYLNRQCQHAGSCAGKWLSLTSRTLHLRWLQHGQPCLAHRGPHSSRPSTRILVTGKQQQRRKSPSMCSYVFV